MRIVRFSGPVQPRLGLLTDGAIPQVIDLVRAAQEKGLDWLVPVFSDLRAFLFAGQPARDAARHLAVAAGKASRSPLAEVKLLAPFEAGSKILAHVVNYFEHGAEANLTAPERPFFFYKPGSAVSNPGDPIIAHRMSAKADHEVELAVVIGRQGRDIPESGAYDFVGGYTVLNDVSFRDFQRNEGVEGLTRRYGQNWTQGKGLDGSCPIGPMLVLTDELADPYPLAIECRVNGEVRQKASTADMIYKVPQLVADISRGMTLYPGDIISTGTCAGGGVGTGKFLQPGDVVECEIERIGTLMNQVVSGEQGLDAKLPSVFSAA